MTAVSATDKAILIEKLEGLSNDLSHLLYVYRHWHRCNPADPTLLRGLIDRVEVTVAELERWLMETRGFLEAQP